LKREFVLKTLTERIRELGEEGFELVVLSGFGEKMLSVLPERMAHEFFWTDDLKDPAGHIKRLEKMEPGDLLSYFQHLVGKEKKVLVITKWLYAFIYRYLKVMLANSDKVVVLGNNSGQYGAGGMMSLEDSYNLEAVHDHHFSEKYLFQEVDYKTLSNAQELLDFLGNKNVFSLKTSQTLKDSLISNGIRFVKNYEYSDVQLFDVYSSDVRSKLIEITAAFQGEEKANINPVCFNGYFPGKEVQDIDLEGVLRDGFGFSGFREYEKYSRNGLEKTPISQKELVQFLLDQNIQEKDVRDLFFISGTGSGKSLIFQLTAYLLKKRYGKMTIVISPLKSLMKDQKDNSAPFDLKVEYDNSDLSYEEQLQVREKVNAGVVDIIQISPERFLQASSYYLNQSCNIGLVVIDEAHLVSTWGKTFRVDYAYLGELMRSINKKRNFPILSTTATCVWGGVLNTVGEISELLHLKNPFVVMTNVVRENIQLDIVKEAGSDDLHFDKTVDSVKELIDNNNKSIVYASFARDVDLLVSEFRDKYPKLSKRIGGYTGQMDKRDKIRNQNYFKNDLIKSMVATKAFGMGIDVANTDTIMHHDLPCNLSEYIQEVGRAGRNKEIKARAFTFYNKQSMKNSVILSKLSVPPLWTLNKTFSHIAENVKNIRGTESFTISLEDIMYLFYKISMSKNQESYALSKARIAVFLVQKDLEKKFGKPILYRQSESYQYLYFSTDEKTGKDLIARYPNAIRYHTRQQTRKSRNSKWVIKDAGPVYSLDITAIWERSGKNRSLKQVVYSFFNAPENLLGDYRIYPLMMADIELMKNPEFIERSFEKILGIAENFCQTTNQYFTENAFNNYIRNKLSGVVGLKDKRREVLTLFKNQLGTCKSYDDLKFFKLRTTNEKLKIKKSTSVPKVSSWKRVFHDLLETAKEGREFFFHENNVLVRPVLNILDILEFAKVNYSGGNNTMITLRCADNHARNCILSVMGNYKSSIQKELREKIEIDQEIARHFYETEMTNEERWAFLEQYFLGEPVL